MAKVEKTENGKLGFNCPGCGMKHAVAVDGEIGQHWRFNGNYDKPTLSPSVLVTWKNRSGETKRICHSFVRDGMIEFLSDCTHTHAGKTLPLTEVQP